MVEYRDGFGIAMNYSDKVFEMNLPTGSEILIGEKTFKTANEEGFSYPGFLDEDFEVVYKFDTESLLEYYSGILSLSGLEKITGINQKQLWSYLHRKSKPRKAQVEKIENGLHASGNELISISL